MRLVKGAYREPRSIAYRREDRRRRRLCPHDARPPDGRQLSRHRHARSGHDRGRHALGARAQASRRIGSSSRCCYGIRRDLQRALVDEGYRVRVYIPFGRQWFPYFMRRLGERPANVGFVVRGILSEG